jgi:hypothetical protein
MLEALLTSTALALGLAIGFVIAWARGGKTREELAALQARAEEQEKAAADKLALTTQTQAALAAQFKALSAEALDSTSQTFLQLATAQLGQFQQSAQSDLAVQPLGRRARNSRARDGAQVRRSEGRDGGRWRRRDAAARRDTAAATRGARARWPRGRRHGARTSGDARQVKGAVRVPSRASSSGPR